VPLDRVLHETAQPVRLNGIKFNANVAKALGPRVARLGRPRRQISVGNLRLGDGDALKINLRTWGQFAERLLDLFRSFDAGRVEITRMVDVGRDLKVADVFGRVVQERERGVAAYHHQRHTLLRRAGELPYDWLADNTRWQRKPDSFDSIEEALQETARIYRKNLWANADAYVEIWLEKDAFSGVICPITAM
jgi:hypothetical protein